MFTIPNETDAAFPDQAEPDKVDIDILAAGMAGDGVLSGCAVTAQGTPDMTVAVAAGAVLVGGTRAAVGAGNVTITAADGTNPRFDLIVSDNAGAKSAVAGTPSANPVFPAIPANSVVLAAVYVPASDAAINSNQIVDKRVLIADPRFSAVSKNTQTGNYTLVLDDAGKVVEMNVAGANTLTVPPNADVAFPIGTIIEVHQYGAGQTTITPGTGVTLRSNGAKLKTTGQYSSASLRKRDTNEWVVAGDLSA